MSSSSSSSSKTLALNNSLFSTENPFLQKSVMAPNNHSSRVLNFDSGKPSRAAKRQKLDFPRKQEEEEEKLAISLPFFDSSTSPEELEAMLFSELNKIKSGIFSALEKIESSHACDVAKEIGYDHLIRGRDEEKGPFLIKKKLETSDVGNHCRLMLTKKSVQDHIIPFLGVDHTAVIQSGSGVIVKVYDHDTRSTHLMNFKMLPSSKCYVFNKHWKDLFVMRRNLKVGNVIGLYWDSFYSRFCFSVLKRA